MAKNPSHGSANYLVTFTPPFGYFHFCYTRHEINLNFFRAFPIIYAFFLEKVHISKKSHCNVVYCHTYGRMRRNVCLLFFLGPREKIWNKRALFSLFDAVTWFGNHLLFEEALLFFSCLLCWWSQFSKIKASITLPRFKMFRWSRAHKTNAAISPKAASLTQFCKKFLVEKGLFGIKRTIDVVILFGKCDFDF